MFQILRNHKDKILSNLVNLGTVDLLLHILQSWVACVVDEKKWSLIMVLYCSGIMYKYENRLGFFPIKDNR